MINRIKQLLVIKPIFDNHQYLNKHFVLTTNTNRIYALTHNKESFMGLKNIKISDTDVVGLRREQFLVPFAYYYDETKMELVTDKRADSFLIANREKLENEVKLIENEKKTIKNIEDHLDE